VIADLTKEEDVQRLINDTIKEYGQLDILVNNAGAGVANSIKDDTVMEKFDSIIKLDLRSIVQLTHLSIPYLLESKGTIINTSSIAGISPV
jgi:NAD(P)-dependent dehydrogenase (short-subunit alcohol dehydrogenase family)